VKERGGSQSSAPNEDDDFERGLVTVSSLVSVAALFIRSRSGRRLFRELANT
jgi:hypothetical protein